MKVDNEALGAAVKAGLTLLLFTAFYAAGIAVGSWIEGWPEHWDYRFWAGAAGFAWGWFICPVFDAR